MLPSLHALHISKLDIEAKRKRYIEEENEVGPFEQQEEQPEEPRETISLIDLDQKAEEQIITRALDFGFAAMPAPLTKGAYWTVFCISTHRLMEGFGIIDSQKADEFDQAANVLLEYLSISEELDAVGIRPWKSTDIDASPFDNFSKFKKAVEQKFPEDDPVWKLFAGHVSNMANYVHNIQNGKYNAALDLIRTMGPQLLYTFVSNEYGGPPGLWENLDQLYKEVTSKTYMSKLRRTATGVASRMVTGDGIIGSVFATAASLFPEDKWYDTVFNFGVGVDEAQLYHVFDEEERRRVFTLDGLNWRHGTFYTNQMGLTGDWRTNEQKSADYGRVMWARKQTFFGSLAPWPRLALFVGYTLGALTDAYISYRKESILAYLKSNGELQREETHLTLQEKAQKLNIRQQDDMCLDIEKNVSDWRIYENAIKNIWKLTIVDKLVENGFPKRLLLTSGVVLFTSIAFFFSVPPVYTQVAQKLVDLAYFEWRRRKSREQLDLMAKVFVNLKDIETKLTTMEEKGQRKAPLGPGEEPCGGKDLKTKRKKHKEKMVRAAIEEDGNALKDASETMRADPKLVLIAVKQNGLALQWASDALRVDREVVLAAVQKNGGALQWALGDLRADKNLVLAAVKQNGLALEWASDALRVDRGVVLAAVQKHGGALKWVLGDLSADKELVLAAVEQNGLALEWASDELKNDRGVVLAALEQNPKALEWESEELKNDRVVWLAGEYDGSMTAPEPGPFFGSNVPTGQVVNP